MKRTDGENIADAMPHRPVQRSYRCAAHGCPMAGAIFERSGQEGGICAYHYGANTADWGRITRALTDWDSVTAEIGECRRVHMDPQLSARPDEVEKLFKAAAARMEPLVGTWWDEIKPQAGKGGRMDTYRDWGMRLETFIGSRVVGELTRRKAA